MKYYKVKYTKLFNSGNLKGLTVECVVSHVDLDHAARFVKALGCSSKVHNDLITNAEYQAICAKIYAPGELERVTI